MTERVGAWLTGEQVRARNKELRKVGKRICIRHQGVALPLTEEHFYYDDRRTGRFETLCKSCRIAGAVERNRLRYQTDPTYVAKRRDYSRVYRTRYPAKIMASNRREWLTRKRMRMQRSIGAAA